MREDEEADPTATLYSIGQVAGQDRMMEDLEVGEMNKSG